MGRMNASKVGVFSRRGVGLDPSSMAATRGGEGPACEGGDGTVASRSFCVAAGVSSWIKGRGDEGRELEGKWARSSMEKAVTIGGDGAGADAGGGVS